MRETNHYQKARKAALSMLSKRAMTEVGMRTRLDAKFSALTVDRVVSFLKNEGALDDEKFATMWIQQRLTDKPRSRSLLRYELINKGVETSIVEEIVKEIDDDAVAYTAGASQAKKLSGLDFLYFRRKLWGFLNHRGFNDDVSINTINQLWKEHGANQDEQTRGL